MRHPKNANQESCLISPKASVESVRSKYILSKTIDGLEKSSIVKTDLTVCMMEMKESFVFQNRRIDGKKIASEKENNSFFRTTIEMEAELKENTSISSRIYLGNLRKKKEFVTLKKDFLCVTDGEANGNLKEKGKETLVFIKLLKCENEDGKKRHLPLCLKCNPIEKTKAIIKSVTKKVKVTAKFIQENIAACIHSNVGELLFSKDDSAKANLVETNCNVVVDDDKKHLCISFDGETHGLVFVNRARKGNKGNCLKCKSIRCSHVQVWNKELKKTVLKEQDAPLKQLDIEIDIYDGYISEDVLEDVEEDESLQIASCQRLDYPYNKETQEQMRDADSSQFSDLIELVSKHDDDEMCHHKNKWSAEDPRQNGWIYSSNVNISHSNYVAKKERTVFYRRTTGACDCILPYDGKADMLLPVSRSQSGKVHNGRLGFKFNLVSLSLLSDFVNDFFKNGTTMRGFYKAYQSKCTIKFGMDENEVISWKSWRAACVHFVTKILRIDEKEVFQCVECGPRPKALVFDGIAMGMMKSELNKYKDEFVKELVRKSRIDIKGSKFNDRMFIKLSRNRKILRKASENKAWPDTGIEENSDSDPEYEVGEKRKKTKHDEGMDQFLNFLKTLDKSARPSPGIVLLMQNLSSSTSTIGMMQEFDQPLIEKIEIFLKGDKKYNFLSGITNIDMNIEVRKKYPVLMKILEASVDQDGTLAKPMR